MGEDKVLQSVRNLVHLELSILGQQQALQSADEKIRAHPELLVNQVLLHFQQLFNVRSMEGVLPKMNQIYVFNNEMANFLQLLRPVLGLSEKASTHAILSSVEELGRRCNK